MKSEGKKMVSIRSISGGEESRTHGHAVRTRSSLDVHESSLLDSSLGILLLPEADESSSSRSTSSLVEGDSGVSKRSVASETDEREVEKGRDERSATRRLEKDQEIRARTGETTYRVRS